MLKIVVVDDQQRFAQSVAYKLNQEKDIEVVGVGHDGEDAVTLVEATQPDMLLTDLEMRSMHGDEAIRLIRRTNRVVTIMVFSRHADATHLRSAFDAGANGYVLKGETLGGRVLDSIVLSVREAMEGRFSIPVSAATIIHAEFQEAKQLKEQLQMQRQLYDRLTRAEFGVLTRLDQTNAQIAQEMSVSVETVKSQVASLMKELRHLGITSRDEAVDYARRAGLIDARPEQPE
jgi:DNA-binding NarL/FixJ family response regulator